MPDGADLVRGQAKVVRARALSPAQRLFLKTVLATGGNLSAAYRAVNPTFKGKPSEVASRASRMARGAWMREAMAEARAISDREVSMALARYNLDRTRLCERLMHMGFTDIDQVADVISVVDQQGAVVGRQVLVKELGELDPRARAGIRKLTQGKDGRVTIELEDRQSALLHLARLMGWIQDKPIDSRQLVTLKIER